MNITFHNSNTGDDLIQELIKVMALVAKSTVEKELIELSKDVTAENDIKIAETAKTKNDESTYLKDTAI